MVDGIFKTNNSMEIFNTMECLDLLLKKKTNGENEFLLVKNTNNGERTTQLNIGEAKGLFFVTVTNTTTGSQQISKIIIN